MMMETDVQDQDPEPESNSAPGMPDARGVIRNALLANSMRPASGQQSTASVSTDVSGKQTLGQQPGDRSELMEGESRMMSPINALMEQAVVPFGNGQLTQGPGPGMVGEAEDRNDAFGMYLGFGQENGTYRPARHTPADADPEKRYVEYDNPENLQIVDEHAREFIKSDKQRTTLDDVRKGVGPNFSGRYKEGSDRARFLRGAGPEGIRIGTMGEFTFEKGKDNRGHYVSYRDTWDISKENNPYEREQGSNKAGMGTPFEIYGRRYYDPDSGEILDDQPHHATTEETEAGGTRIVQ